MKLSKMTIKEFIEELAYGSPTPGGGSNAPLSASLGAALTSMVATLAVVKEKYRDSRKAMEDVGKRVADLKIHLLELTEDGIEAFDTFMAALRLPKEIWKYGRRKNRRREATQEAEKETFHVSMRTLRVCHDVTTLAETACVMENPNAISDIGTAAILAQAAARSPAYNVKINLMELANETLTVDVRSKIDTLLSEIKNHVPNVEEATGSFLR